MSRVEGSGRIDSDLKLAEFLLGADLQVNRHGDVDVTSGELNLAQAILHRIRTSKGELAELGHPEYGSSILDFIGLENNWTTRQRLKLAIRDALRQESRIKEIVSITVNPRLVAPDGAKAGGEPESTQVLAGGVIDEQDEELGDADLRLSPGAQGTSSPGDIVSTVDVDVVIVPAGSTQPLQVGFPINLEGVY